MLIVIPRYQDIRRTNLPSSLLSFLLSFPLSPLPLPSFFSLFFLSSSFLSSFWLSIYFLLSLHFWLLWGFFFPNFFGIMDLYFL